MSKKNINEELTKSELSKELKIYLDSEAFKTKVEKIVKDRLKTEKVLEDRVVEITRNVLTQLYKALWTKRSFWRDNLNNKTN